MEKRPRTDWLAIIVTAVLASLVPTGAGLLAAARAWGRIEERVDTLNDRLQDLPERVAVLEALQQLPDPGKKGSSHASR